MRILLLTTDAYGGHGGIALYNRDLADALAEMPEVDEILVVPRTMPHPPSGIPGKVRFFSAAALGKWRYLRSALLAGAGKLDLVVCGHINLLPLAVLLNIRHQAPLALMVYGIDVWKQPSVMARFWLRWTSAVWSISALTRDRMNQWAQLPAEKFVLLPNAIHLERYGDTGKRADLLARLGLQGRKVVLTLARLSSSERYKGIDEILLALPAMRADDPDISYLVAGEGDDRPRLEARVRELGLHEHVVFSGFVDPAEKADFFRLADVFAMPGSGEGFGFVFLEAMACGVPVVGSCLDGSREALRNGELGELVDPSAPDTIAPGIFRALARPRGIPAGLNHFAWPAFRERLARAVQSLHNFADKAA